MTLDTDHRTADRAIASKAEDSTMKACVRYEYGPPDVLRVEEIEKPEPLDDEIRVEVRAASLNLGDWELLTGHPLFIRVLAGIFGPRVRHPVVPVGTGAPSRGLLSPKYEILGCDIAGRVDAVGRDVTDFQPGDEVFGMSFFGAFAEYVCVPKRAPLARKPPEMSWEDAASLPQAALLAVQGIRDVGRVQPGQKVLINGAGGGAGTLALQLAKSCGAEVTGVDNAQKQDLMRSLGADHVVDYAREDFAERGEEYDLIFDLVATRSVFHRRRALAPGGLYLTAGGTALPTFQAMLLGPLISRIASRRVGFLMARDVPEDLVHMAGLVAAGTVRPIVDRTYPLSDVRDAVRLIGEGGALGKIVIAM